MIMMIMMMMNSFFDLEIGKKLKDILVLDNYR